MAESFPSLNGVAQSWADIGVTITVTGGTSSRTDDIVDISYGTTVEVGEQRGVGMEVKKRTRGQRAYEGKITFYADGMRSMLAALAAAAPSDAAGFKDTSQVVFDVLIQHSPPGAEEIGEVQLLGCRLLTRNASHAEGTDPDKREGTLSVGRIIEKIGGVLVV
jgi:2-polyprenyl-6-methoxyphenol hydroxylase-like FAD-dependent oxidoreductase